MFSHKDVIIYTVTNSKKNVKTVIKCQNNKFETSLINSGILCGGILCSH